MQIASVVDVQVQVRHKLLHLVGGLIQRLFVLSEDWTAIHWITLMHFLWCFHIGNFIEISLIHLMSEMSESIEILKKPYYQNFHLFSPFQISSTVMSYSRMVRSTWHALLYTKQNLSVWGFTMPKGFGIGQHIREIPGTSNVTRTFGHSVLREKELHFLD